MTRRVATPAPVTRPTVYYYPLPEEHAALAVRPAAELAAQRRRDAVRYERWKQRQATIAAQDRQTRHFLLGLGAVVGTGVLGGIAAAVWAIWRALAGVEWIVVLPLIAIAVVVLGRVGHRCITIVQHWH